MKQLPPISEFARARAEKLGLRIIVDRDYCKRHKEPGPFYLVDVASGYHIFVGLPLDFIPDALRCVERERSGDVQAAWMDFGVMRVRAARGTQ